MIGKQDTQDNFIGGNIFPVLCIHKKNYEENASTEKNDGRYLVNNPIPNPPQFRKLIVGAINRQNNNYSYSMDQEEDNDNDEYYVPIQTRLGLIIVKPNRFGQADAIALDLSTCQFNTFLQTSRPGSLKTIKVNWQMYQALKQLWTTWI